MNNIKNVKVNSMALGDLPGSIAMTAAWSASHVLLDTASNEVLPGKNIPMTTLDIYAKSQSLGRLDFIKMDVE